MHLHVTRSIDQDTYNLVVLYNYLIYTTTKGSRLGRGGWIGKVEVLVQMKLLFLEQISDTLNAFDCFFCIFAWVQ